MRVELRTVTPEMASQLLSGNVKNRTLSSARVAMLAAEMKSGRWQMNGETVIISESETLLDGQHRLAAVVASGVTVPMLFALGTPDNAIFTIDTGRSRKSSDILAIEGVANPQIVAAAAGHVWRLFHNQGTSVPVPAPYVMEVVARYPSIVDLSRKFMGQDGMRTTITGASIIPAMVYLNEIARRPDLADTLWEGMRTGANMQAGSPVLALRNRIMNMRGHGIHLSLNAVWPLMARVLTALESGASLMRVHQPTRGEDAGAQDRPAMFERHVQRMDDRMRLADLLPPTAATSVARDTRSGRFGSAHTRGARVPLTTLDPAILSMPVSGESAQPTA